MAMYRNLVPAHRNDNEVPEAHLRPDVRPESPDVLGWIDILHVEVPRVDYEKLSCDRWVREFDVDTGAGIGGKRTIAGLLWGRGIAYPVRETGLSQIRVNDGQLKGFMSHRWAIGAGLTLQVVVKRVIKFTSL